MFVIGNIGLFLIEYGPNYKEKNWDCRNYCFWPELLEQLPIRFLTWEEKCLNLILFLYLLCVYSLNSHYVFRKKKVLSINTFKI